MCRLISELREPTDAEIVFEAEAIVPWETYCYIELVTSLRDMQGVLVDALCRFPDSADDEGYRERVALLGLNDGNMLLYSNIGNQHRVLRRCE